MNYKNEQKENIYQITLGGIGFYILFQISSTQRHFFSDYLELQGISNFPKVVSVPLEEIICNRKKFGNESFTEFNLLLYHICNLLLPYNRCLFHAVAICINDRAWLISAPSGTGKSTQYRHWKTLFGDEVRLICGDKPILEFQESGGIVVHPSPWKGKERWSGSEPAKLAGIIYLEQGDHNEIRPMSVSEAVVPLYTQVLYQPKNETELRQVSSMLDHLLRQVPVWKLINVGDEASVRLTYETICGKKGL